MKIETNSIDKYIAFKEIEQGQVFMYMGEYYMKTKPLRTSSGCEMFANAVKLKDGNSGYCIQKHEQVTIINAKVVIEE